MNKVSVLAKSINDFFNAKADAVSMSTGFIKRKRKLKGSAFLKALILGNMSNPNCSIEMMCQMLNEESISITKQGLDFRFTKTAVDFMESMYKEALIVFKSGIQIECEILKQFSSVKLLDSTYITLPNNMEDLYKGYGSSYAGQENKAKSGVKIQLVFDYLNQLTSRVDLKEGIRSDQGYRDYLEDINKNDLLIADLGYFVPESFKAIDKMGAYFISRYKSDTNIYEINTGEKLDIIACLNNKFFLEKEVFLGKKPKVKVRIIAQKLTEEQSKERRRKANKLAKSHGYTSSKKNQKLLDWSIFITNVEEIKIQAKQVFSIYKIRWQIELLFKLYKSHIMIADLKAKFKSYRVLCELYAKLCITVIFHGMYSLIPELKKDQEISLTKAIIELRRRSRELFLAIKDNLKVLEIFLLNLVAAWSKFSLKDTHRKKRISSLNSLKLLTFFP